MGRLKPLQEEVEQFIEKNRIHLMSHALIDKSKFKNRKHMEDEIRHAKIILTNSVGKFLMQKGKMNLYVKESKLSDGVHEINFNTFVFSGSQLRDFVEMIEKNCKPHLKLIK